MPSVRATNYSIAKPRLSYFSSGPYAYNNFSVDFSDQFFGCTWVKIPPWFFWTVSCNLEAFFILKKRYKSISIHNSLIKNIPCGVPCFTWILYHFLEFLPKVFRIICNCHHFFFRVAQFMSCTYIIGRICIIYVLLHIFRQHLLVLAQSCWDVNQFSNTDEALWMYLPQDYWQVLLWSPFFGKTSTSQVIKLSSNPLWQDGGRYWSYSTYAYFLIYWPCHDYFSESWSLFQF